MVANKFLVSFLAVAVFTVSAAPSPIARPVSNTEVEGRDIHARDGEGCVKLCADHYLQGGCYTLCGGDNQCMLLTGFNDQVSSLEVQTAGWTCTYYEHTECTGASFTSDYDATLHDGSGWWADRMSSLKCWQDEPCPGGPFDPICGI
ncbi:hypothetical protein V8F20_006912 [Naviculisporaceae sp. PSN 640]